MQDAVVLGQVRLVSSMVPKCHGRAAWKARHEASFGVKGLVANGVVNRNGCMPTLCKPTSGRALSRNFGTLDAA